MAEAFLALQHSLHVWHPCFLAGRSSLGCVKAACNHNSGGEAEKSLLTGDAGTTGSCSRTLQSPSLSGGQKWEHFRPTMLLTGLSPPTGPQRAGHATT